MISLSDFLLHCSHLQPGMNDTSALVGLLLAKLNQYFEVYISTNMFFWLLKLTIKIGNAAPLMATFLRHGMIANENSGITFIQ